MDVTQQSAMQRYALGDGHAQDVRFDALATPRGLDVGLMVGPVIAEHDGEPCHALATDQPHLDRPLVTPVCDHGRKPAFGKVDRPDRPLAALEDLANGEFHRFEMRRKQAEVGLGETRKYEI